MEKDLEFYAGLFSIKSPEALEGKILEALKKSDKKIVSEAFDVARSAHKSQTRIEGTPYVLHPLRMSYFLISCSEHEIQVVLIALLHDVLEDSTDYSIANLEERFGKRVPQSVAQLSKKIPSTKIIKDEEEYFDYFLNSKSDADTVNIKLLDRIDNLISLTQLNPASKKDFIEKYIKEAEKYFLNFSNASPRFEALLQRAIQYAKDYSSKNH